MMGKSTYAVTVRETGPRLEARFGVSVKKFAPEPTAEQGVVI